MRDIHNAFIGLCLPSLLVSEKFCSSPEVVDWCQVFHDFDKWSSVTISGHSEMPESLAPAKNLHGKGGQSTMSTLEYDNVEKHNGGETPWKWTHPTLGTFLFNPRYGLAFGHWTNEGTKAEGALEVVFYLHESFLETEGYEANKTKPPRPSDILIDRAIRVQHKLKNERDVYCQKIAQAFWDDIHGVKTSGMWWSDDLEEAKEGWEPEPFPESAQDMARITRPITLRIIEDNALEGYGFFFPYFIDAEIANFEEEHGLGVGFSQDDEVEDLGYSLPAI